MEENNDMVPARYINTPFQYTRFSANLSKLQQDVMIKVSDHIQSYLKKYFGSELKDSKDVPRPLFSEADKANGIEPVYIPFAELGVDTNNFFAVDKAVDELMNLRVKKPVVEDGNARIDYLPIFIKGSVPIADIHQATSFKLNPEVVDYVFDMSQGYVTHPVNIAYLCSTERMPMIYYFLRHKMLNWKKKSAQITLFELKDYLGMIKRDKDGQIIKIQYPKFSQFVSKVLKPAIEDVERLYKEGQVDVTFSFEPKYRGAKKVGDPQYILFSLNVSKKQKDKPTEGEIFTSAPAEPSEPKKPEFIMDENRKAEWGRVVSTYQGSLAELLSHLSYLGTYNGFHALRPTPEQRDLIDANANEWETVRELARKIGGYSAHAPVIILK